MKQAKLYPRFYETWLDARFGTRGVLAEDAVDCGACAMTEGRALPPERRDPGPFRADLKCCTYFPFLPNFTLGALLESASETRLARVRAALRSGVATPLGLFASPDSLALKTELGPEAFGRAPELACPFLDEAAGCSIWAHRPGVCASYFCASTRGREGLALWRDVEEYLSFFEWALAHDSLFRVGFTLDDVRQMERHRRGEAGRELAWMEWQGREEELYRRSYRHAKALAPDEIDSLLGTDGREREVALTQRLEIALYTDVAL